MIRAGKSSQHMGLSNNQLVSDNQADMGNGQNIFDQQMNNFDSNS